MKLSLPTIIILHGWSLEPDLKKRWQPLIKKLNRSGFEVKYLPLPGFDKPLTKKWSLNDYRQYVLNQLPKEKKIVLIGHSFGGQLAVRVAASSLKNCLGLILIGPAGVIDKSWKMQLKRSIFNLFAKSGAAILRFFGQGDSTQSSIYLKKLLYFFAREDDYQQASSILKQTMTQVLQDEVIDDLPKITIPTLLIWGDRDRYTPIKNASIFLSKIYNSQLKLIEGEGHRPYYTQPDLVADHIIWFLKNYVK